MIKLVNGAIFISLDTKRPDGKIVNVLNSARTGSPTGPINDINGTVYQTNPDKAPGELLVNFPSAPQSKNANCKYEPLVET